VSGSEL
jgi:hypothetical protein